MKAILDFESGRFVLRFDYSPDLVALAKEIPGASYRKTDRSWSYPPSWDVGVRVRTIFGPYLSYSPRALRWIKRERKMRRVLRSYVEGYVPELPRLRDSHPELWALTEGRPWQRSDMAWMKTRSGVNANPPGLGKTVETIGAAALLGPGRNLVLATTRSVSSVWVSALEHFQPLPVLAGNTPDRARAAAAEALELDECWLVVGHAAIRSKGDGPAIADLAVRPWQSVTIDEFRKVGLSNATTQLSTGLHEIDVDARRWALSGTPMGGRIWNLWGVLNWLDPDAFPARWAWMKLWGETRYSPFTQSNEEFTGRVDPARAEAFRKAHSLWMLRRPRSLLGLPPKNKIDVWSEPTPRQRRAFKDLAINGQANLDDGTVLHRDSAGVNLQHAKRISSGLGLRKKDNAKLLDLEERLVELGVFDDESEECAIVASVYPGVLDAMRDGLPDVPSGEVSGEVSVDESDEVQRAFQAGELRLVFISTLAAGVALDFSRAGSIHVLDETFDPDDQEQLLDRADRGERTEPLFVYRYGLRGTVDEAVRDLGAEKLSSNADALPVWKKALEMAGFSPGG